MNQTSYLQWQFSKRRECQQKKKVMAVSRLSANQMFKLNEEMCQFMET